MKTILVVVAVLLVLGGIVVGLKLMQTETSPPVIQVTNFEECVFAGNPVMESYPRQCRNGDQTFIENIGNELEKTDLIRINTPRPNEVVHSPLRITGEARGNWFFEASFPVFLTDWDGRIIGQGIATAQGEWMTTEFVPFEATLTYTTDPNVYSNRGSLILRKDNPSGLPEHDDALEIPVVIGASAGSVPGEPQACTKEAKICPDGSAVGRTGPNCAFAPCPGTNTLPQTSCTSDADCPSAQYMCEEIQGTGTACPSTDPSCVPTHTITEGVCKLVEGSYCTTNADCTSSNVCHKNVCTAPIGRQCTGASDTSCPADFECIQSCGSPVGYPDEPAPPFFCQLKGYTRTCPICLAKDTLIDTPLGVIPVQNMQRGDPLWTISADGKRVPGFVIKTSATLVPAAHRVVSLILDDGRTLYVSPGHPLVGGGTAGELTAGDVYDGAHVVSADLSTYTEEATYDILSSGETGFYYANGILLDSTLHD